MAAPVGGRCFFRDRAGPPSGDLDVLPEAEALGHPLHRGARRLVRPGGAVVARAVDHHVVELDAMRAGAVRFRLRRLFEPLQADRRAREIVVAVTLDDIVALGDHAVVEHCLHVRILQRGAPKRGQYIGPYPCSEALPGAAYSPANFKSTGGLRRETAVAHPLGATPIQIRTRSPERQLTTAAPLAREIGRCRAPRESKILAHRPRLPAASRAHRRAYIERPFPLAGRAGGHP